MKRGDRAAGDRSESSPRDVWVYVAVQEVVNCAAGSTHNQRAGGEEEGCAEDCREGSYWICKGSSKEC